MTDVLYRWPAVAKVGSRVPKEKFYEHANVSSPTRKKFIDQVARITWQFKLAESTVNLPGDDEVREFQVFAIEAKASDVDEAVLLAIDKAVKTPIIFEVRRETRQGSEVQMAATLKLPGRSRSSSSTHYYRTEWLSSDHERAPMPIALNLAALYLALLQPLTSVEVAVGQGVAAVQAKLHSVRQLERQISMLESRMRNEPQINRKIELRRDLKAKEAELALLTGE